jgi:predicted RND superfamily exporter protein
MEIKQKITAFSIRHYKLVAGIMIAFTLVLGAMIPRIKVDTDPENMLSADEPVRVFHNQTKKRFALSDIVVLGIVNKTDPNGVFNPSSLARAYELTEFARTLRQPDEKDPNSQIGVLEVDLLAPSTVDHIGQREPNVIDFQWLMKSPPATDAEARDIRDKAMSNPLLKGTVVSEDGKAICLYLPLTGKDLSHRVYKDLKRRIPFIDLWTSIDQVGFPKSADARRGTTQDVPGLLPAYKELRRLVAFQAKDRTEFKADYVLLSRLLEMDDFSEGSKAVTRALETDVWKNTVERVNEESKISRDKSSAQLAEALKRFERESSMFLGRLQAEADRLDPSNKALSQITAVSESIRQLSGTIATGKADRAFETSLSDTLDEIGGSLRSLKVKVDNLDALRQTALKVIRAHRAVWRARIAAASKANSALDTWLEQASENPGVVLEKTRPLDAGWLRLARLYVRSLRDQVLSSEQLTESVKDFSSRLAARLVNSKALGADAAADESELAKAGKGLLGDEQYHITGLPVAEDTFGYEMFVQMAVSAPLAMVVIFILMLLFFRKLVLVISPMIIALVSVIATMGLLIGLGFSVHIMSSMIPIFLMPIAVVDSVHILSEFFDLYTSQKGRKNTIIEVMGNLFVPMLYTSLTSAAGFASLALTPIPPVQVFGIFVAIGIMIAWISTVTFVPAYVMMISDKSLVNFGHEAQHGEKQTWLARVLGAGGRITYNQSKPILIAVLIVTIVAAYGITRIKINDNPVKWFSKRHPIRKADIELNRHFGGTYMAYLVLDPTEEKGASTEYISELRKRLSEKVLAVKKDVPDAVDVIGEVEKTLFEYASQLDGKAELLKKMASFADEKLESAPDKYVDLWYELSGFFELEAERIKPFKQPEVLGYISRLQQHLEQETLTGNRKLKLVGKSNSVADVVKKVHQELKDGKAQSYRIPDSQQAVAECLFQFQSSHNPDDLWHLVTYDYMHANIWLQLTSGDNKDMEKVVRAVDDFVTDNPPPVPLKHNWAGLTYINTVWQDKMVWGMLQSFLGSFIIVFIMMAILFRSPLWGIVCMVPLTITIAVIYGIIGLVGKDYDMPVAVLSALTLGMAVDFAIHFLERARVVYSQTGSWETAAPEMFGEPARAISRNVLVIAIGFLPLLAAPLVPYKTVGIFLCAIMGLSGAVTLLVLPAAMRMLQKMLFTAPSEPVRAGCNCALCFVISAAAVLLVALNLHQFAVVGWNVLAIISVMAIPLMALVCGIMSRRQACRLARSSKGDPG